jgi:hypothetical protein
VPTTELTADCKLVGDHFVFRLLLCGYEFDEPDEPADDWLDANVQVIAGGEFSFSANAPVELTAQELQRLSRGFRGLARGGSAFEFVSVDKQFTLTVSAGDGDDALPGWQIACGVEFASYELVATRSEPRCRPSSRSRSSYAWPRAGCLLGRESPAAEVCGRRSRQARLMGTATDRTTKFGRWWRSSAGRR